MLKKLKEHAGIAALLVAVMAVVVAATGIAGALPGNQRATGALKVTERTASTGTFASGDADDAVAKCKDNETAVGGGFSASSGFGRVDGSRPQVKNGKPIGWHVFVGNDSPGAASFEVEVLCAKLK